MGNKFGFFVLGGRCWNLLVWNVVAAPLSVLPVLILTYGGGEDLVSELLVKAGFTTGVVASVKHKIH